MSDIIIIPQIKESEQDDHFIELDCNTEEDIVTIPPIKELPECPENENQDNNSIIVVPQIKECRRHNVTLNVKDLKNLVEAAKQDIGTQLGSLATKKEVQDLSDRIPDDVASMQYVLNRDSAIESLVHEKEESVKSFVLALGYVTLDDVNEQINAIPKYTAGDNITIDGNVITAEIPDDIAKETTLLAKVAELKEALNTIDFTAIEQAIQGVEGVTAKEATLIQGVEDIIKAVENIDFTDLENSIAEVKNAVANIDFSALAKLETLTQGINTIAGKVDDLANKQVDVDLTPVAKEETLNSAKEEILTALEKSAQESTLLAESEAIKQAIADKPEVDLSGVAKEATSASILSAINSISTSIYKGVPIVSQAEDATIAPNVWNVWGDVTALTITKGVEVSGVVNSYLIRFVAAEGCALTFDGFALQWYGGSVPTWNAGSTYEINIVDNLALWAEFTPA